jgi:hypothetical protein
VTERRFSRPKDFRRIFARYDILAGKYFVSVQISAIVAYRIN